MAHPMNLVANANELYKSEGEDPLDFKQAEHLASIVALNAVIIGGMRPEDPMLDLLIAALGVDMKTLLVAMANMIQFDMEAQGRSPKDEMQALTYEVTPAPIKEALETGDDTALTAALGIDTETDNSKENTSE